MAKYSVSMYYSTHVFIFINPYYSVGMYLISLFFLVLHFYLWQTILRYLYIFLLLYLYLSIPLSLLLPLTTTSTFYPSVRLTLSRRSSSIFSPCLSCVGVCWSVRCSSAEFRNLSNAFLAKAARRYLTKCNEKCLRLG